MGRSRLVYRSKHKGILSENSRKAIREARQKQSAENVPSRGTKGGSEELVEEEDIIYTPSDSSEEELSTIDLMDFRPVYIREREIIDFRQEIGLEERQQEILFPNPINLQSCLQSAPFNLIMQSINCDSSDLSAFDERSPERQREDSNISPTECIHSKLESQGTEKHGPEVVPRLDTKMEMTVEDELDELLGF